MSKTTGDRNLDEWKRCHRQSWFNEGFKAAKVQATKIIDAIAENEDWRPEDARISGMKPSRIVRMLKRASNYVRNMPRPAARPDPADVECEP